MPNSTQSPIFRFVSQDFSLRASALNATEVLREMQTIQNAKEISTLAVGRAMMGAALMATHLKDNQEVGVLIKSSGPLPSIYAHAGHNGAVRGYSNNPQYHEVGYDFRQGLKGIIGKGLLTVVRHQPFQRSPYQGTVELVSGEIGDDLAYYLHQSQQIRSIVYLAVHFDELGSVKSSGGVLIEVMPGVEDKIILKLEENFTAARKDVAEMIFKGGDAAEFALPFLKSIPVSSIPHEFSLHYHCPCNEERVLAALGILGDEDLKDITDKNETTEITCQMCGRLYQIPPSKVFDLRAKLAKESLH